LRGSTEPGQFLYEPTESSPAQTVLYDEHLKRTNKSHIVAFAGHLLPVWFTSIADEHAAVRHAAGLFDCTHMGILEVSGKEALPFLDAVTTNDVQHLQPGAAQYSYILDAAGNVLDDIILYRRADDKFMLVVNAVNEPKIKAYFEGLRSDKIVIDPDDPDRRLPYKAIIRDIKIGLLNGQRRVDIALQGPRSLEILAALCDVARTKQDLADLAPFRFLETQIHGLDCLIARTGYTGSRIGFELFVHPDNAPQLWNLLLDVGEPFGLVPCGLGARDSLRIEAGLPLYGHELAGPFNISPFEAGYGWAVKLEKSFFIGKMAIQKKAQSYQMKVARIELPGQKGIRPVRPNDPVLDEKGSCIGWVLSAAKIRHKQIALAYIDKQTAQPETPIGLYYLARSQNQIEQGRQSSAEKGQTLTADITGTILRRFEKF